MNKNELQDLWNSSNEKLERSLSLHEKHTADITNLKVDHFLSSMKPLKIFTIIIGIIWVGTGVTILSHLAIYSFEQVSKFFFFSAALQIGLTALALFIYLYQLILLYQVDLTEPVLKAQKRLANLKVP